MTTKSADGVATALRESMPSLDPEPRARALALIRLLAQGEPVTTAAFADAAGLERGVVERLLEEVPGLLRDDRRRVISFMGISLEETPHRMEVDSASLYAHCAWDTLFLPRLIGGTARVRSACRQTGDPVSLTVSPDAVAELSPRSAVLSMLVPEDRFGLDVIGRFCHHVHFFTGPRAGERWLAEREGDDAFLLTVAEGFRLGGMWTRHLVGE